MISNSPKYMQKLSQERLPKVFKINDFCRINNRLRHNYNKLRIYIACKQLFCTKNPAEKVAELPKTLWILLGTEDKVPK